MVEHVKKALNDDTNGEWLVEKCSSNIISFLGLLRFNDRVVRNTVFLEYY